MQSKKELIHYIENIEKKLEIIENLINKQEEIILELKRSHNILYDELYQKQKTIKKLQKKSS